MERLYYNIVVSADANSSNAGKDLTYSEQFQQPLLSRCSDYYLAITRFQLPSSQVPLMVMPVRVGQNDVNQTPLLLTLTYSAVDYQQYVQYIPDSNGLVPPAVSQSVTTAASSEYYYIYSVNNFLKCINATIDAIMTVIRTAGSIDTASPYFVWQPTTQLLSLVCTYDFLSKDIGFSVNNALFKYFEFFRWEINNNSSNGKDYTLVINDDVVNWWALPGQTITDPPAYLNISEELSTSVANWFCVKSVVITTASVPVLPEFTPIVGASNSGIAGVASRAIITDFQPSFEDLISARSMYTFSQTGPYRVAPMLFDQPLSKFDLSAYWTDTNGNFIQWQLGPGESASFKIAFIRKDGFFA